MGLAGDLATMQLEDLLGWLSAGNKSGTLHLHGPGFEKRLVLEKGFLTASASSTPREQLGYFLVGWGYLTSDELDHAYAMQDEHQALIGELLVLIGQIERDELEHVLRANAEEVLFDAFQRREGEFHFVEDEHPSHRYHPLQLPLLPLTLEGARRRDQLRRLTELVPSDQHIPKLVAAVDMTTLSEAASLMVRNLDGQRTVEQIALAAGLRPFEGVEFVAALIQAGVARLLPPTEATADDVEELSTTRAVAPTPELAQERGFALADRPSAAFDQAAILELAVDFDDLISLDCTSHEGFILSRVGGRCRAGEVLRQLPGDEAGNRSAVESLIERGILAVRG